MTPFDQDETVRIVENVVERTPEQIMDYARCVKNIDDFAATLSDRVFWAVFVRPELIRRILAAAQWGLKHKIEEHIAERLTDEITPVVRSIEPPTEAQRREIEAFLRRIRELFSIEEE